MALLKLYRGAVAPTSPVQGMIWFNNVTETVEGVEQVKNVIKVYTGTEWEVYGITDADLQALAARVATLEGDVKTIKDETLPALKAELKKYADDAVAAEAEIARAAEEALGKRIDAVVAASVSVAEKTDGHVTVSKSTDETTGAVVYTIAENDIASAQGLADEIKRAGDEEARIEGLVTAEAGRAAAAEEALAGRLDVIEGEGEGSIKKAVADAKAELIGDATEAGNTLGKLEDRIETIVANEKTYSIAKVESGLGENVKEAYKLVDEDGTQVGETINIYKDSSLISVDLVDADAEGKAGQYIKYVYVLANGEESTQYVDVSRLLVEAEFKNGLEVSAAGEISVKVDATSEAFLTVGADGVKLSGVQDAIDAAEAAAKKHTDDSIAALNAEVASTDGAKVTVKVTEVGGKITTVNVTESDIASAEALATLDAEVQEHEVVVSAALNDLNARVDGHATRLDELEGALADKNVAAESTTPDYVTATAADNKVTVAATKKVIDAVALAETSVQEVTSNNSCLTAVKTGNSVALSLVWEEGSF